MSECWVLNFSISCPPTTGTYVKVSKRLSWRVSPFSLHHKIPNSTVTTLWDLRLQFTSRLSLSSFNPFLFQMMKGKGYVTSFQHLLVGSAQWILSLKIFFEFIFATYELKVLFVDQLWISKTTVQNGCWGKCQPPTLEGRPLAYLSRDLVWCF